MAYIPILSMEDAPPELQEIYKKIFPRGGEMDEIISVHSLNPRSMQVHYDLYRHLMFGPSDLSRIDREMIGVVVSRVNSCHY